MTPEKLEKTMQFILEEQAQLTANMHKHDEAIAALEKSSAMHDSQIQQVRRDIQEVTNLIGRLAVAQTHTVERVDTSKEEIREIREIQKESADRLNALISIGEKYLSGRNGGATPGA